MSLNRDWGVRWPNLCFILGDNEIGKEKGTDIIRVKVNPKFYRPTEVEQLLGDPSKVTMSTSLLVSRVLKYPKKYLEDLTAFFMSTWRGDSKNMKAIELSL